MMAETIDRAHLGDQGELWFASVLPQGWIWQPPRRDFGKDGLIVIRDSTNLHDLEFSVQIKTSASPRIRGASIVLSGIPRSAVRYWFASPLPTLVVAVDISSRKGWYVWHQDLFDSPKEFFDAETKTVTIRVPTANELDEAGWNAIREYIERHFRGLQRALWTDSIAPSLMATVYQIARIVGNLIRLGATAPPEPPLTKSEGMSLLIEQIEVRDLIDTVTALLGRLPAESEARKQIDFWRSSFEQAAEEAFPRLKSLPPRGQNISADLELVFAPKLLLDLRPRLVLGGVDLIRLLLSPQPHEELSDEEEES